ncbi:MAG: shikimate kinase [Nitrospirales bacterium]|nr:shikimate kinase [Nitrospira sp.]MDR4500568.1 shikimate kinase [Nitrospirales bacterium]
MNIVLIGYRGTGKSTVAKLLGQRLGRRVMSTDAEVVARAKMTIPEIVERFGWDHFRGLETEVCQTIGRQDGLVIDTGGGAILKGQNVTAFKTNGTVFWLTAEVPTIASRIGGDTQRPSLSGTKSFVEEIEEILKERTPKYQAAADHSIATDHASPERVTASIFALLSDSCS